MTQDLQEKVEERLVSESRLKDMKISGSGFYLDRAEPYHGDGNCANCGSDRIHMKYKIQEYRGPQPDAKFGRNVKPRVSRVIVPVKYHCKKCHAENADLQVLAPNFKKGEPWQEDY